MQRCLEAERISKADACDLRRWGPQTCVRKIGGLNSWKIPFFKDAKNWILILKITENPLKMKIMDKFAKNDF